MNPLSNEELASRVQHGIDVSASLEQLYFQNIRFIRKIISSYNPAHGIEDDLLQECFFAIYRAATKYDPDSGNGFLTYATWWIRQGITRYLQENGYSIRLPVGLRERIYRVKNYIDTFEWQHGEKPSTGQIAHDTGLSIEQVERALYYAQNPRSLDAPLADKQQDFERSVLSDVIPDDAADFTDDLLEQVFREELSADLWRIIEASLSEKEADVVRLMFRDNATMADIARQRGVSREYVRQVKERAFKKLRTGKFSRLLREYHECQRYYLRGSLSDFRKNGSSIERTAIKELEIENSLREETRRAAGL